MVPYSFISYFHDQVKVHFKRSGPVNNIDKRIILTLMVMIFFSSCDKEGIINGGAFISASKDRVSKIMPHSGNVGIRATSYNRVPKIRAEKKGKSISAIVAITVFVVVETTETVSLLLFPT